MIIMLNTTLLYSFSLIYAIYNSACNVEDHMLDSGFANITYKEQSY